MVLNLSPISTGISNPNLSSMAIIISTWKFEFPRVYMKNLKFSVKATNWPEEVELLQKLDLVERIEAEVGEDGVEFDLIGLLRRESVPAFDRAQQKRFHLQFLF